MRKVSFKIHFLGSDEFLLYVLCGASVVWSVRVGLVCFSKEVGVFFTYEWYDEGGGWHDVCYEQEEQSQG